MTNTTSRLKTQPKIEFKNPLANRLNKISRATRLMLHQEQREINRVSHQQVTNLAANIWSLEQNQIKFNRHLLGLIRNENRRLLMQSGLYTRQMSDNDFADGRLLKAKKTLLFEPQGLSKRHQNRLDVSRFTASMLSFSLPVAFLATLPPAARIYPILYGAANAGALKNNLFLLASQNISEVREIERVWSKRLFTLAEKIERLTEHRRGAPTK
jgi:hypothetical protein